MSAARRCLAACALVARLPQAWPTSAEVHGPVELQLDKAGQPCAHVHPGSPNEARQGWSAQLWATREGTALGRSPLWQRDARPQVGAWPDAGSRCIALPAAILSASQPYTIEISSIRLYKSRFCWDAGAKGNGPRLLAVDEDTGRCTATAWSLKNGHALSPHGWWDSWRRWWHGL